MESPERLSKPAYKALSKAEDIRELSSVSLTEIAIKMTLRKLNLSADIVRQALEDMKIHILPFTADHGFRVFDILPHHRDPFDRQIIAQALSENIPVVTPDEKFRSYKELHVIW